MHRERYLQAKFVDFSGLKFENNITPMDIDGSLDFKDELFFYIEFEAGYDREEAEIEARKMMIERRLMLNKIAA